MGKRERAHKGIGDEHNRDKKEHPSEEEQKPWEYPSRIDLSYSGHHICEHLHGSPPLHLPLVECEKPRDPFPRFKLSDLDQRRLALAAHLMPHDNPRASAAKHRPATLAPLCPVLQSPVEGIKERHHDYGNQRRG